MKAVIKGRGQGKTREIVLMSSKNNIPIICVTEMHKKIIHDRAKELGVEIPEPITITELRKGGIRTPDGVLIDDVEFVIQQLLGCKYVYGISFNSAYDFTKKEIGRMIGLHPDEFNIVDEDKKS